MPNCDTEEQTIQRLRDGRLRSNPTFDSLLPHDLRARSALHWTPLNVARRVAKWVDEQEIGTVLDIGSGVGKFCVAAALAGRAKYVGIEQRSRLVTVSRELAACLGVAERASFIHGTFGSSYIPEFDAYYLYNPFGENLFGPLSQIDRDVELSEARYWRDIATIEQMLAQAPVGTYLITYNGFGGRVPASYSQIRVDRELPNVLRMWQRTKVRGARRAHSGSDYCQGALQS